MIFYDFGKQVFTSTNVGSNHIKTCKVKSIKSSFKYIESFIAY